MSVTDIAAARGVSKQAISKQLSRLGDRVPTRTQGTRKLVDVAAFDALTSAETDPAQALRNRAVNPNAGAVATPQLPLDDRPAKTPSINERGQAAFTVQRARREGYDAELMRITLEEKTGKLVHVRDVEDSMVEVAHAILRVVDGVVAKAPVDVRAVLKAMQQDIRKALHDKMKLLAMPADDGGEEEAA